MSTYLSTERTTRSSWSARASMASFSSLTFWPPPMEWPTSPPFHASPIPNTWYKTIVELQNWLQTKKSIHMNHNLFIRPCLRNSFSGGKYMLFLFMKYFKGNCHIGNRVHENSSPRRLPMQVKGPSSSLTAIILCISARQYWSTHCIFYDSMANIMVNIAPFQPFSHLQKGLPHGSSRVRPSKWLSEEQSLETGVSEAANAGRAQIEQGAKKKLFTTCFNHRGEFWTNVEEYPFGMDVYMAWCISSFLLMGPISSGKCVRKTLCCLVCECSLIKWKDKKQDFWFLTFTV